MIADKACINCLCNPSNKLLYLLPFDSFSNKRFPKWCKKAPVLHMTDIFQPNNLLIMYAKGHVLIKTGSILRSDTICLCKQVVTISRHIHVRFTKTRISSLKLEPMRASVKEAGENISKYLFLKISTNFQKEASILRTELWH